MSIFQFEDSDALGQVQAVDTATVVVRARDLSALQQLQVNRLAVLQSSRAGHHLVGIIQRIRRTFVDRPLRPEADEDDSDLLARAEEEPPETNLVHVVLIGTLVDRRGERRNLFVRTLEIVPDIAANCFALEGEHLTRFMQVVSSVDGDGPRLSLGNYTLDDAAEAFINGNRFFQRHAIVVGSTGSGKSWTTARLLEQVAALPNANAIVFDIHGEYSPIVGPGIRHFRVAGTGDLGGAVGLMDGVLYLPYWLLAYEALHAIFVDRNDTNAPNQAMVMSRAIVAAKRRRLSDAGRHDLAENFTIDSPIPFDIRDVVAELEVLNTEMVPGARAGTEKQGDFHGKLSRLIQRLENKRDDRRLGFLFQGGPATMEMNWLQSLVRALLAGTRDQVDGAGGVKVINFSEVPSDVLPIIVSLVARLVFSVQQWLPAKGDVEDEARTGRHPVALLCDEAHLYIPERSEAGGPGDISVGTFERIAKEGRKYGVGLVVISQRPSEVNRTVLSQCNNLIAMRLTNGEDQSVVRKLLPDSLGGFSDLLPILDTGEALLVGDATLLPTRVRIAEPRQKPNSGTVDFWDEWAENCAVRGLEIAVENWRRQTLQRA